MNWLAVAMILVLALSGCTSAPTPEQPVEADRAPCTEDRSPEGAKSYTRCIRHVATLAMRMRQIQAPCVSMNG